MNLFEKMLDPGRIEDFLQFRGGRQIQDLRVAKMQAYLSSDDYKTDVKRLWAGDYNLSLPVKKLIPKGYTNRMRTVYHFTENEMTLLRMMSFVMHDYDALCPKEVYSFKKGISARNFISRVSTDKRLRNMFVAKTDIAEYGNSIDPDILIGCLQRELAQQEPEAVAFFTWLFSRGKFIYEGKETEGNAAALLGIPIHNFFTNLYLVEADRFLIPKCVAYARYSDDIIMYCKTRQEAENNLKDLHEIIRRLGLRHHEDPHKTNVFSPGEPYDYLGISFAGAQIDIAETSLNKLKRKMRIRAKRIGLDKNKTHISPQDKARHLIRLNGGTFFGRPGSSDLSWAQWAFPVITKTDGLHELDLYNQHCIRYVLTGKWSDAQYRISYEELRALGYVSLVRTYYAYKEENNLAKRKEINE
ncbi:MAG: RNA-directed DNA polymerase [Lachnospiraceae bacterium]|nr:RNA-directed DNA polymerase [Lachnospiraceae bacterium]